MGSVQIVALRPKDDGKLYDKILPTAFEYISIPFVFSHTDEILKSIPPDEHWNLYYTMAEVAPGRGRNMEIQRAIPFDIDGIDTDQIEPTIEAVLRVLRVDRKKVAIIFSGHGLQIIIGVNKTIDASHVFDEKRPHYKAVCARIDLELRKAQLPGKADPAVWSHARLMRLPNTENRKKDKPPVQAYAIESNVENIDFHLEDVSKLPLVDSSDCVAEAAIPYAEIDTETVLKRCEFLKYCFDNQATTPEPEWYAMLSILARLENGEQLCHDYSKNHPQYTYEDCSTKIQQAISASGPRTCKNVNALWGGCQRCPHNGRIASPILLKSDTFIKTKNTGFREITFKDGVAKPGRFAKDDLVLFFKQQNDFISIANSGLTYRWNGKFWEYLTDTELGNFCQTHVKNPSPTNQDVAEFLGAIRRMNVKDQRWLGGIVGGKINFQNGVLDMTTGVLESHDKEMGFQYVLPYSYDPHAVCPTWDKFIKDVTCGREDLALILEEFIGYFLSGDVCWTQKALMLVGVGSNGKSVFLNILRALAGEGNYSSITLSDLKKETNRTCLMGKLFNASEETAPHALKESSLFKNLVTGGETSARYLYKQTVEFKNRSKLVISCNEFPQTDDTSNATARRLVVVPFDAIFDGKNKDPHIEKRLLNELGGIFNAAIRGYNRLRLQEAFTQSAVVDEQLKDYQSLSRQQELHQWMNESLDLTPLEQLNCKGSSLKDLYNSYRDYCRETNEHEMAFRMFTHRLSKTVVGYKARLIKGDDRAYVLRGALLRGNAQRAF